MDGNDHKSLLQHFEAAAGKDGKKTLSIDVERYQNMLDEPGLTEDQKRQAIEALWSIIIAFVELGYGVHPAQEVCGKHQKSPEEQDKNDPDALNSEASSHTIDDQDAPRS
ncbi:MAG: hypothetical protein HWE30_18075 [Methylocystaceae bacterium]|nr:hypothetical protein [Methylocystaceae bacterium]